VHGWIVTDRIHTRSWLGIIGLSLTEEISRYYNLPAEKGVLVTKIADGSPAEEAGIVAGDIIFRLDSVEVYHIEDLLKEIHNKKVGEKIRIFVLRRGREHFFDVTLSKMP